MPVNPRLEAVMDRARTQKQLEHDEGRRRQLYRDSLGYYTIGIGRLLDPRLGGRLREDEIDYLFSNDLDAAITEVQAALPWYWGLNDARQAALVNMAFQLGLPKLLKFSSSLGALRDEHWEDAAYHLSQSAWAHQTPDRAKRVIEQLRSGEWQY